MSDLLKRIPKEGLFQIILILALFIASAYDRNGPAITMSKIFFYINYVLAALFISYYILPRFFYKKNYKAFFVSLLGVIAWVVIIEEFLLEKLFFAGTRKALHIAIIPCLLDVLPIIIILVGFKFAWDAQQKQGELERLNTAVAESRMQFLKSQINPHFLFNNLNNLYAYSLENSPKTPTIILQLSSLLRYMLYDCQAELVPLEKEIKSLRDFIHLQELQIEDRGDVQFKVSGATSGWQIAPLILIVFIENCFKHSTSSQTKDIAIDIELRVVDQQLVMECSNSYSTTSNTQNLSNSIGLKNVKARLDLLYPNSHQLTIQDAGQIYKVQLALELQK